MKYPHIAKDSTTCNSPEKAFAISFFFNVRVKINPAKMPSLFFPHSWINYTFFEIHSYVALIHKFWKNSILIKCINKFYIGASGGWHSHKSENPTRST